MSVIDISQLYGAVQSKEYIKGLTHNFYKYPARFSPQFVRSAIQTFTKPGEIILDPFMGGGTTLVEARALGRSSIGIDISPIAAFVTRVKTRIYSRSELKLVQEWISAKLPQASAHAKCSGDINFEPNILRNLNSRSTWPIRNILGFLLSYVQNQSNRQVADFIRCILLNSAQWALDNRKTIPSALEFREKAIAVCYEMIQGADDFRVSVQRSPRSPFVKRRLHCKVFNRTTIGLESEPYFKSNEPPRLIITSPPYPGVHVVYSRWQIQSRRETPAPFWIINAEDGHGLSHYTFGDRKNKNLDSYFINLLRSFKSIRAVCGYRTVLLQLVAFSDPELQLNRYLSILNEAGFCELKIRRHSSNEEFRMWRSIPNRKWYSSQRSEPSSAKEVMLIHTAT